MNSFRKLFRRPFQRRRKSVIEKVTEEAAGILLDTKADKEDRLTALVTLADVLFPEETIFATCFMQPTKEEVDIVLERLRGKYSAYAARTNLAIIAGIEWATGRPSTLTTIPSCLQAATR